MREDARIVNLLGAQQVANLLGKRVVADGSGKDDVGSQGTQVICNVARAAQA